MAIQQLTQPILNPIAAFDKAYPDGSNTPLPLKSDCRNW